MVRAVLRDDWRHWPCVDASMSKRAQVPARLAAI